MGKNKGNFTDTPKTSENYEVTKLIKTNLIKKFQRSEGNFDCFASASAYLRVCHQFGCLWRDECLQTWQE